MKFDVEARRAARPAISFDEALPVNVRRIEIAEAIHKHQVVVVCGERCGMGAASRVGDEVVFVAYSIGALFEKQ